MKKLFTHTLLFAAFSLCTGVIALAQPTVTTGGTAYVTFNTAQLQGTAYPNGTSCISMFQIGTASGTYNAPVYGNPTAAMTGTAPQQMFVDFTNSLTPNTTYYYRAVLNTSAGYVYGAEQSFTTQTRGKPILIGAGVEYVPGNTYCSFRSHVNPNNWDTDAMVEYGTTTSYGSVSGAGSNPLTGFGDKVKICDVNGGLLPNETYHWRVKAQNYFGITYSPDYTFTTDVPSSIPSATAETVAIYPNPAQDVVMVDAGTYTGSLTALVYDINGKCIEAAMARKGNHYELNVSKVSTGTYFLLLNTGTKRFTRTFYKS